MSLGLFALLLAFAGAGWLLFRLAQAGERAGGKRNVMALKAVVWLGLAAALFAAKLWPLAFMVLLAAGGVTAIEMWREKTVREDQISAGDAPAPAKPMDASEAAAILGVAVDADSSAVRAAHKKLIAQIHPDRGGTDYLAAKINAAREILLARADEKNHSGE